MSVDRVNDLTCSSQITNVAGCTYLHQWNHVYSQNWVGFDGTITNYTTVRAYTSKYTLTLEKFDNLTTIYSNFVSNDVNNNNVMSMQLQCGGNPNKNVINLVDNGYYHYTVDFIVTYTDKPFKFNCQQYSSLSKYVYVAWINSEGNRVIVFKNSPVQADFSLLKTHNGSILCCIYYVETTTETSVDIRRFVKSKTLFVYQENLSGNDFITNTVVTSTEKNYRENTPNISVTAETTNNVLNKSVEIETETNKQENSNKENIDAYLRKLKLNIPGDNTKKSETAEPNENPKSNKEDILDVSTRRSETVKKTENECVYDETDSVKKIPDNSKRNHKMKNKSNDIIESRIGSPNENPRDDISLPNDQKGVFEITSSKAEGEISKVIDLRNETENSSTDKEGDHSNLIIIIIYICATLFIVIVLFIIIKCCCKKKPATRPPMPLPNNERPFYLNLLFEKECERERQAIEQPVYEEIDN
ncbi:uncharacterized protein LOC124643853 isoform X2 [Helicoverpa zea]|nr:uncharacterized protein LOC124643853 isoform X2 [Helicoverpa zea]XP_047038920.1 uncharacterized protein LOC124643853 isoform X2 [Helicoverpa zea]XP_047038921.1 uncharacterized protein LOC124643853 isoform X2 [Helicoverpa zea]XP_047038922.1 uncharacterized protein LOC124643853 isoform X2 [Helicoverpa zea]